MRSATRSLLFFNECIKVLVSIQGVTETERILESAIAKETDTDKKKNLRIVLELLKEPERRSLYEDMYKRANKLE